MTIYFPDVSNHEGGLIIQPATVAVIAKATEGTFYTDPYYANFKAQAAKVGAIFVAYHFLHAGNTDAQAQLAYSVVGPNVPLMIDFEPTTNSNPVMADCLAFRSAYEKLGGKCVLTYLPKWYWTQIGMPSLSVLAPMGLIASDYTVYSDSGPGWEAYGGVTPLVWQYTDRLSYGGQSVDFNAYRGTVAQFQVLVDPTPVPDPPPPAPTPVPVSPEDDDMPQQIEALDDHPSGKYSYMFPLGQYHEVAFGVDTFGGVSAQLRVVFWTEAGADIRNVTIKGLASGVTPTVLAFSNPAATYGMTVTRTDAGASPIGIAFK